MLDLRYPCDRRRWNRICDRWLQLVMWILIPTACYNQADSAHEFINYVVFFPAGIVAAIGAVWVAAVALHSLFDWLRGY